MKIRFKDLGDASVRCLLSEDKYPKYEKYLERNNLLMKRMYTDILSGKLNYIGFRNETHFECLHRSTREGHLLQLSVGFYRNGKLYPDYHVNIDSFEELEREGFYSGVWEAA